MTLVIKDILYKVNGGVMWIIKGIQGDLSECLTILHNVECILASRDRY